MAQGAYDANGVWIYGEDDVDATASDMLNRLGKSVSAAIIAQRGRSPYPASNGGSSNGWFWTNVIEVTFPRAFPSNVLPVVSAQAVSGDHLQTVTITSVSQTGFAFRVMRLASAPTLGTLHWTAERATS